MAAALGQAIKCSSASGISAALEGCFRRGLCYLNFDFVDVGALSVLSLANTTATLVSAAAQHYVSQNRGGPFWHRDLQAVSEQQLAPTNNSSRLREQQNKCDIKTLFLG